MADPSAPPILVPSTDAPWYPTIVKFALTWNGYDRYGPLSELGLDANHARMMWEYVREVPGDLASLRSFLFFEQRRWRHLETEPVDDNRAYIDALLTRIRALTGGWVAGPPDDLP